MGDAKKPRSRTTVFGQSLLAAREGTSAARGTVLEACRAYLLVFAARGVRPDLRAKVAPSDLVQETFAEAHRHFGRFDGATRQQLLLWLRGILRHRLKKAQRKFRATAKRDLSREIPITGLSSVIGPGVNMPAESPLPGQQMIAEEDASSLAQVLGRLPADYQQVIRLRNWELRSFVQIGEEMHRSTEAARSLWSRAVQRLTAEMESPSGTRSR